MPATLPELLKKVVDLEGSDLHLTTETPPQIRVHGHLQRVGELPLTPAETKQLAYSVLTDAQKHRFEENLELDFSFGLKGLARFRDHCGHLLPPPGFQSLENAARHFEQCAGRVQRRLFRHPFLIDKKGPWQQYPYRMLQMRARSWGLRDGFADALKGMQVREEIEDIEPVAAEGDDEQLRNLQELKRKLMDAKDGARKEAPAEKPNGPARSETRAESEQHHEKPGEEHMRISPEQLKRLWTVARGRKIPEEAIRSRLMSYGYSSSKEIKAIHYDAFIRWAESYGDNPEYGTEEAAPRFE